MRLNKETISKLTLPPGKSELIVFDDTLPGFGIRIRSGGTRVWVAQYRAGTKQRRVTLGSVGALDPDEARRAAKQMLAKVQLGADPQAEKAAAKARSAVTLGATIEIYLAGYAKGRLKAGTYRDVARHLRTNWKPQHDLPLHAVDRRAIAARLAVIGTENGKTSANRCRASLSAFFGWCMREGLVDANPVIGTNTNDERARDRVLSDAELVAIWRACGLDHYGSIVKLLLLTGQRRAEIGELQRSEIDVAQRRIRLPGARTKNGQPHDVPLSDTAFEIARGALGATSREHLFGDGGEEDGPFAGWSKCKRRLDGTMLATARKVALERGEDPDKVALTPWRLHDLRRTVATRMADLGVQPHVIEAVLNHVSGHKAGVAGIYNRSIYAAEKRQALDLWAAHVEALVSGGQSKVVALNPVTQA